MIVRFSLKRWKSFRDEVTFSMIGTKERQHGGRVPKLKKYQTKILPIAAICGGNASGKTNFFKAINFARSLVINGTHADEMIPVDGFLLDTEETELPSCFTFELLTNDIIYEFSFAVTSQAILAEKLVKISGKNEEILYDRHDGSINFDSSLDNKEFLKFVSQSTRKNQLFLTNAIELNVEHFRPVYNWFKAITLVRAGAKSGSFEHFLDTKHPLHTNMNDILSQLDTGISRIYGEEIPIDALHIPDSVKTNLKKHFTKEDGSFFNIDHNRIITIRENGELIAMNLGTYHRKADGTETRFEISQESDGSIRVIDLLPAFLELMTSASGTVYIIDEIDRSLHTLLTRKLLDMYLSHCTPTTRSQLLFTTHDVMLMDQHLLRRDEMWVTERDASGNSKLFSFSDYRREVRYDKDIRKIYLQGRLGGIPRISNKKMGNYLPHPSPPLDRRGSKKKLV